MSTSNLIHLVHQAKESIAFFGPQLWWTSRNENNFSNQYKKTSIVTKIFFKIFIFIFIKSNKDPWNRKKPQTSFFIIFYAKLQREWILIYTSHLFYIKLKKLLVIWLKKKCLDWIVLVSNFLKLFDISLKTIKH